MNPQDRQHLLATEPNPDPGSDYAVAIVMKTPASPIVGAVDVSIHYVPDKLILKPQGVRDYLSALVRPEWPTVEAMAISLRDDISNETVPRWLEVRVTPIENAHLGYRQSVILEDRQPQWDNSSLLARIRPL
jgi:7-cyano-7-deazaguanine reductase